MKNSILHLSFLALPLFFSANQVQAQISISPSGTDPDPSAMLDVQSTEKGLLAPRMTTAQRDAIATPATGLTVFVTSDSSFYYFDGTNWALLGVRATALPDSIDIAEVVGYPDSVLYMDNLPSQTLQVEVLGNYAFALAGIFNPNFNVYDVSDPANIILADQLSPNLTGTLQTLHAFGNRAVALTTDFLFQINISNPTAVQQINAYPNGANSFSKAKLYSEDIVVTMSTLGQVTIREFSTGTVKTVQAGGTSITGSLDFSGQYAFIVNNAKDSVFVVDFSDVPNASVVHKFKLSAVPRDIAIQGDYAYVAQTNQVEIIDITDPLNLSFVKTVMTGIDNSIIQVNGDFAFTAANSSHQFKTIAIADPANAQLVHSFSVGAGIGDVDIENQHAYVLTSNYKLNIFHLPGETSFLPIYDLNGNVSGYQPSNLLTPSVDNFSLSGNNILLSLSGDGVADNTVDLSPFLDNTDTQDLSLSGNTLNLTNGGSVDLSGYLDNTDAQALSLSGSTLSLTNGGSVDLTGFGADNLGNHTATQNIVLNGNWISNDGSNNGLFLDNANNVGIGISSPAGKLHVFSTTNPLVTFKSNAGSTLILDRGATNNETALQFRTASSDNWLVGMDNLPSGNSSDFSIKKTNNGNAEFIIKTDGKVGIGAIDPAEKLEVNGAVKIGTSSNSNAGTIRWTGDDFEGFDGSSWKSLTESNSGIDTLFAAVSQYDPPQIEVDNDAAIFGLSLGTNTNRWQSFTAEHTGELTTLVIDHDGIFIDGGYLRIYAGEGISGDLLHEQTIDDSNISGHRATYELNPHLPVDSASQYTFEVVDTVNSYKLEYSETNPYPGGIYFGNQDRDIDFKTYVAPFVTNVGLSTNTPSSKFHVKDNFARYTKFVMTVENTGNKSGSGGLLVQAGENSATGNTRFIQFNRPDGTQIGNIRQDASNSVFYAATSDERLKTQIVPTAYRLDDLLKIDVRDYFFKDDLIHPQTGFIAQQLFEHYPNAVTVGGADAKTDPWQVDYSKLTPLLVKSVQELKQTVDAQAQQLQAQQAEMEQLKNQNTTMQSRLEKIEAMLEACTNTVSK